MNARYFALVVAIALLPQCVVSTQRPRPVEVLVVRHPAPPPPPSEAACEFGDALTCAKNCVVGDAPSCNNLGAMYEVGEGVEVDRTRAIALFHDACVAGAKVGCYNERRLLQAVQPPTVTMASASATPVASTSPTPAPSETREPSLEERKAQCAQGNADACRTLPGVHISGNVHIHGNVTVFGDVYIYK